MSILGSQSFEQFEHSNNSNLLSDLLNDSESGPTRPKFQSFTKFEKIQILGPYTTYLLLYMEEKLNCSLVTSDWDLSEPRISASSQLSSLESMFYYELQSSGAETGLLSHSLLCSFLTSLLGKY